MHFQPTDPFNTYQSQCELENFKEQRKEELDFQASVKSLADSAKKTADLAKQLAEASQQTADSANALAKASEQIAESAKLSADLALKKI